MEALSNEKLVNRTCAFSCDRISIFDRIQSVERLTDLCLVDEGFSQQVANDLILSSSSDAEHDSLEEKTGETEEEILKESMQNFSCRHCQEKFDDLNHMRAHFRSASHQRKVQQLHTAPKWRTRHTRLSFHLPSPPSSESDSEEDPAMNDDSSFSSGSDSEAESSTTLAVTSISPSTATLHISNKGREKDYDIRSDIRGNSHLDKLYFRNRLKEIVGIYRCLLYHKGDFPSSSEELMRRVEYLRQSTKWALVLWSGSKFACGVFDGTRVILHRKKHRYTSRRKQGGSQLARDAKSGVSKSAGSQIRRQQEIQLHQELNQLLHVEWAEAIRGCDLVLLWVPKRFASVVYPDEGVAGGFGKNDPRLRRVGINVGVVSYQRMVEIHSVLSHYDVFDAHADVNFLKLPRRTQANRLSQSEQPELLQETETGRLVYVRLPDPSAEELREEKRLARKKKQHQQQCERENNKGGQETAPQYEEAWFTSIFTPLMQWDVERLLELLLEPASQNDFKTKFHPHVIQVPFPELTSTPVLNIRSNQTSPEEEPGKANGDRVLLRDLNRLVGPATERETLLHFLVRRCQSSDESMCDVAQTFLWLLLLCGCDPGIKNSNGQMSFEYASTLKKRHLQLTFRKFRHYFPNLVDYEASKIPEPLDPEVEKERKLKDKQRKKVAQTQKKQRVKEQEEKEMIVRREEAEKQRFLQLSDREKRALAAEQRLVRQCERSGQSVPVASRCFKCGVDITGKVPFQYLDFNFCTPACLKAHRFQQSAVS